MHCPEFLLAGTPQKSKPARVLDVVPYFLDTPILVAVAHEALIALTNPDTDFPARRCNCGAGHFSEYAGR